MYFKEFPQFLYDFKYDANTTKTSVVKDITRNVRFRRDILANVTLYDEYDIVDGETPEIIAERVYGNPEYHWIVMLSNDRFDYIKDFPLDQTSLEEFTKAKYNPTLYSNSGSWHFTANKLYYKISNGDDAFNPTFLTEPVVYTVKGETTDGTFSYTNTWGIGNDGIDYNTQYFSLNAALTGYPTGNLTITTTGREYNPIHWVNADGFVVQPNSVGSLEVTGVDYENAENEKKRRIKLISPSLVSAILKQFKDLL